jgi:hypothetical protein
MTDRLSKGYEPRFDIDVAVGRKGEEYVLEHFAKRHEVKTDAKSRVTGNIYIEYAQKRAEETDYRPSGVSTSEADYWTYVSGKVIVSAPIENWKLMTTAITLNEPHLKREMARGSHYTLGVIVPVKELIGRLNGDTEQ